jgi:serine/threonine protein phosphatase PrpC
MVTRDDSVVQRLVSAGLITPEQARGHPQKNQLVAALGIDGPLDPHTVARPVELFDGDAFLLCSDGWWEGLEPLDLADMLAQSHSPDEWLDHMQRFIEGRQVARQDNFSAIAVWIGHPAAGLLRASEDTLPR